MANNFEELYDELKSDYRFNSSFTTKKDFEDYLAKSPDANEDMKIHYGVEDATSYLKKKEESDSLSNLRLAGNETAPEVGVPQDNQVVSSEGAEAQGIDLSGQPLPELGYGKGLAPVKPVQPKDKAAVDYYSSEIKKLKDGIDKGSFQSLSSLQRLSSDPYFKQLKTEGYFDADLKSINDSFNKNIYSKSKATFDSPTTKKELAEVGIIPTEYVDFKKASEQIVQKKNAKPPVASDRQKLFDGYLSMYQDPYKTSIEEQTQNALVDSELQKDAERIIKEGKWNFDAPTPENQANSDAKGFIFENEDLMKEVNPIYIGQAVEKYVNNPISGVDIPEELKPIVAKRLERLLLANAEEKLKRDTTKVKVKDLLAKEGKTIEGIKNIPNQAIEEIQKLSDQPLVDANEFKQQSTEALNNELESLSVEQKLQLNTKFAEIKFKADNQMYANEEEYKQDYAQYVEGVNNANIALNTRRLELIGEAEKQFGAQTLTAQQQKKEKLQEIYTKYGITEKDGKLTFKDLQKVEGIYNKVYSEYDKTREASRRAIQTAQFQGMRQGGTMDWVSDRIVGRTANVLANAVESIDAAVGVENNPLSASLKYLQFVETNNQKSGVSITGSKNASDVFEASLGTILDQVPNLALGVTAAVLTKNPYIGGSIAWAQDTQEQVGQNYRDNFRATGSESEARDAAASTLKLQTAMYPAYLLQFAPFMEGFFSTAKGITLKTVTSDIAKFAGTEYAPELITELAQNYKSAKDSRNTKYENMTFSQYVLEEGPKLALEILPSVAAMTGTAMAASRIKEQNTQKQVDAFKAALGERGMTQAVANAIDVMGEKAIFYIPEHFLMTGQITPEQFNRFSQEMGSLVSTYPQVRDTIQNDEKSKFYLDLMEQKKKVETFAETIPEGELKDMFKAKAENIKNTMQDIVNGRDVKYTVFKGKGGFMYVTDNQTASQMITKPGTYSDAIKEGAVEVISSDEAVNNKVKELQKNLVTGAQQVEGISTGTNVNAATVDNTEARNKVVAESTRDNAEVEKLFEDAQTVESAIGNILPNVRVVIHTGTSFAEKMKGLNRPDLVNAKGYYAFDKRGDKFVSEIIINADAADDTTIAHEASHGILLAEFGNNPETFANMKKQLEQIVSGSDSKKLNDFIKGYSEISKPEEYLVQLTAILKSEGKNLSPGILSKIALMINDIFQKLGINIVPFKNVKNTQEVVDYFNSLAASLAGGQQIERKNAVQEQSTSEVSVQPEARSGQEVQQAQPQSKPQVATEEGQKEEVTTKAQVGQVENLPVYFGGSPDILNNLRPGSVLYVTQDKAEAQRYADQSPAGEQPNVVNELAITGNIATEDEARAIMDDLDLNPQTEGYSRGELMLMELLDPNMGESALSASDIKKFNDALIAKGFDAVEFVDNGLQNKESKNIYIANTDVLNGPQAPVELTPAETLEQAGEMEEGSVPLTPGPIEINPDIFGGKASLGEKITIPSEDLLGGKQVNVGEIFAKFKEENGRNPRVWIWMGDQLKRGEYFNPETGVKHFLEGGFNFANDPTNIKNGDIWATGLDQNLLETRLPNCDFIWIMSGSPSSSYNFSKGTSKILIKEINAGFEKLIGKTVHGVKINKDVDGDYFVDFVKIAENILPKNTKKWDAFLEAIKNPNMLGTSARKVFAETLLHQGGDVKISLPFQKFLHEELGIPTRDKFDTLAREKFLVDNNFVNGDLGILLKPNGQADYNNNVHDTYGSTIKGEVVGFPDRKMNVMNVLPKEALTVTSTKTGAVIENPSSPAVIKTAVGDLGKIYDSNDIDTFLGKAQNVRSEKASGTTQVATTTGSYVKAANLIKDIQGDVLDYGAGLGLGTDAMSNTLGRKVDSYEPNPERWQGKEEATYTASDQIGKKYDGIVSLNVLNVVPKDIRDAIVADIFNKLNDGGKAVISTRKWSGDVNGAKNAVPGAEDKSLMITRRQDGKNVEVFQKGFDGNELVDYVQSLLGDKADVVKNTTFGANGVIITKKAEFQGKSQLNPSDISPNFQSDIMSGLTEAEALKNIVKEGYLLSDMKDQLGLPYVDEAKYKEAHAALALESIEKLNNSKKDTAVEIENFINANYMMPMADQVAELLSQGFSHYEIFRTMYNMDIGTAQEYQDAFGVDYRQTIKNAIESENFSDDYLDELTTDTRTIKKKKVAEDLYETWQRAGMDFVDAVSMVEAYADAFEEKGMAEAAVAMRKELEEVTTQEGLRDGLVTFSALLSNAGFMLQLGRNLFPKKMGEMIAKSLERDGIQLTPKQKENLEKLVSDLNTSKDNLDAKANTFMESFSDEDYADAKKAEKQVKDAAREMMKFLDNFKPKFWNDRITSGGSRALLGIQTVGLSVLANVENALFNQNLIVAATRKAYDAGLGGIKSDTFSLANWLNAATLSTDKTLGEMAEMLKYGFESDPNYIEKFYDGLAQVNFFKDTHLGYKMLGSIFGKVNGKKLWEMTDEEYADAFNQVIYKTKDGSLELADGKTYKLLTSLFWGYTLAPQATEITGRLMALGGDKAFANAYTTRALIDYFKNTATSGATGGFIEDYMADRDLTLDRNTLKKLLSVVDYGLEGDNPFEEEGLKKVFLGDNFLSKGLSAVRGKIRKNIKANYKTIKTSNEIEFGNRVTLGALQTADVLTWSVAPFAKVPANVIYVATQKSFPPAALAIYYGSQRAYDKKQKEFDKKYPKAVKKFASDSQKKAYEEAKMELTKLKRQLTYDFAQIEVSFGVAAFALTAVLAGAVIASSEPGDEKDKLYPAANLKAGTYNRTLHMEYLKALMSGKPLDNFAIRRGGTVLQGDKINAFNNMGISGYALGSYSSAYKAYNQEIVEAGGKLKAVSYGMGGLLFGELLTSGAKQLPMMQGFSRLYQAFTDEQGAKFTNWASGTAAASLSVFSPSILSVISKGNAELIQSLSQLHPEFEPSMNEGVYGLMPKTVGKIFANVVQKLNRNVSFLAKNQYYEAMIGPFGEDMQYRTTTSEPGTAMAYLETMINPFASRTYKGAFTLTPAQVEKQKELYRRSMSIHITMVNLALAYTEMTGSEFTYEFEGEKMNLMSLIADQKKNEFTFSTGDTRRQQGMNEIRQKYSAAYSLPMETYREELKKRGELKFYAMQEVDNAVKKGVIGTTQSYIRDGNLFMAQQTIENFFNLYAKARTAANVNYEKDFKSRERNILEQMKQKGVIKKEDYEKLVGIGGK